MVHVIVKVVASLPESPALVIVSGSVVSVLVVTLGLSLLGFLPHDVKAKNAKISQKAILNFL